MTVPMPSDQQDFISKSAKVARAILDLNEALVEADYFWSGVPNFHAAIDQSAINSVPSFASNGLTTTILADGEAALAGIKNTIAASYGQLLNFSRFS